MQQIQGKSVFSKVKKTSSSTDRLNLLYGKVHKSITWITSSVVVKIVLNVIELKNFVFNRESK